MKKRPDPAKRVVRFAAAHLLDDDARMELSKFSFAQRYLELADPDRSLLPLLSFLQEGSAFGAAYARNYMEKFARFHSQIGQDCFVYTYFQGKKNGTFLEIGAGNGLDISNSLFLERELGWTGVLCEPSRLFEDDIRKNRKATLVPMAIHPRSGETLSFLDNAYQSSAGTGENAYPVRTISFADITDKYLGTQTIDYLSLDIEGNETEIIRSIDFSRYDIRVLSIEHNKDMRAMSELIKHLEPFGYRYYDNGYFDWDIVFYK